MKTKVTDINASGTPSSSTYLAGDGSWSTPAGGGGGGGSAIVGMTSALTSSGTAGDTFTGNRILPMEDLTIDGVAFLCLKFGTQQFRFHLVELNNSSGAGSISAVLATSAAVTPVGATNTIAGGVVDIAPTTLLAGGNYAVVAENLAADPMRFRYGGAQQTYGGVAAYCFAGLAGSAAFGVGAAFLNAGSPYGLGIRV